MTMEMQPNVNNNSAVLNLKNQNTNDIKIPIGQRYIYMYVSTV